MTWTVSLFDNLYRTDADQRCLSGAELVDLLTTPGEEFQLTNKALLPMWSAATFLPRRRKKAHVQSLSCLVLDYDESTTLAAGLDRWSDWYRILHTSWSHKPEGHRFRVVLPLSRDVDPDEYTRLWAWANLYSDYEIDRACKDVSRAWALPAVELADPTHQTRFYATVEDGPLLTPDEVMLPPEPKFEPPPRPAEDFRLDPSLYTVHLDAKMRAELGHQLGGVVSEDSVRMVECPRCYRTSVWWWIEPGRQLNAVCNHKRSCGWRGPVAALVNEETDWSTLEQ